MYITMCPKVRLKDEEAERVNEINRMHDEMVGGRTGGWGRKTLS